jgi:hypothetical protein
MSTALVAASYLGRDTWAQPPDHPLLLPKSDVTVDYRLDKVSEMGPHKLQVTYAQEGKRIRVDYFRWMEAKVPYLTRIFDQQADRSIAVFPERRAYAERPVGNEGNPVAFLTPSMTLTRQRNDTVAHAACVEWRIEAPGQNNDQDTACVTGDGIILRMVSPKWSLAASMTATAIHYGPPPEDAFQPPQRFLREPWE